MGRAAPAREADAFEALQAHVAVLERRIQRLERLRLSRVDRERLRRLLPAIAGQFGSGLFLASDVTGSTDAGVRLCCRGLSTKSIGKLFARVDGWPVDGYVVEAIADESGAWLWRLSRQLPDFVEARKSGRV